MSNVKQPEDQGLFGTEHIEYALPAPVSDQPAKANIRIKLVMTSSTYCNKQSAEAHNIPGVATERSNASGHFFINAQMVANIAKIPKKDQHRGVKVPASAWVSATQGANGTVTIQEINGKKTEEPAEGKGAIQL
tara:strand:- start:176 stop:577 length:402 start_codon:yes stop_codon:yes gene_type:complete